MQSRVFHMLKTSMLGGSADVKAAVVYFEAVKMLLSSFLDRENCDMKKGGNWANMLN